jgi:hypothetical protein
MTEPLPSGLTIGAPPLDLRLGRADGEHSYEPAVYDNERRHQDILRDTMTPPTACIAATPEALMTKLFACSGAVDGSRYMEATKFRMIADMTWPEARAALNRLHVDVSGWDRRHRTTTAHRIALAEFALTAHGFDGFQGKRGEHAVKLRDELMHVIAVEMHSYLRTGLNGSANKAPMLSRPIASRLQGKSWPGNDDLRAMVPISATHWVRIIEATAEQVIASLDHLRAVLASWQARRPFADNVAQRLSSSAPSLTGSLAQGQMLPTAAEYGEAVHSAEMLAFISAKLDMLYAGIMHSMPIYRMYPSVSEREAIGLWWPWGRALPLVDGGPAKAPPPRKATLDPSIITTTRPSDIVRQVMQETGMNRTTAQRLTLQLRRELRQKRQNTAQMMLGRGATRAAVARAVGLSPSRISAMFKRSANADQN